MFITHIVNKLLRSGNIHDQILKLLEIASLLILSNSK